MKNYSLWLGDQLIAMSSWKEFIEALKNDYLADCPGAPLYILEE